jgi:RHS repeat-associated protein
VVTGSGGNHYKFSGKERDTESGLDDFGKRYYANGLGRWLSADPIGLSKELNNPQTLNGYVYCFNNPVGFIDPDGAWPTSVHHGVFEEVFDSAQRVWATDVPVWQRALAVHIMQQASDNADRFQEPSYSFMHAMADGTIDETPSAAAARASDFVNHELDSAVDAQLGFEGNGGQGFAPDVFTHFGNAAHAVQDATSPQHSGFQPWYGYFGRLGMNAARHGIVEKFFGFMDGRSGSLEQDQAVYNARVQTVFLWNEFERRLKDGRDVLHKKRKRRGQIGPPSGLDLPKDQSGYGVGH